MNSQQPSANEYPPDYKVGGGLTMHTLLNLPDEKRMLISWILRQNSSTLAQIAQHLRQDQQAVQSLLQDLVNQHFIETVSQGRETYYQVNMVSMRRSRTLHR